jgi:putative redox protein
MFTQQDQGTVRATDSPRTHSYDAPQTREHLVFRTSCGRDLQIGRLAADGAQRPAQGVVRLGIDHAPNREDGTGVALTPAEARRLAAALLGEAAAADHPDSDAAAGRVDVGYLGGECYAASARGHAVLTDQPATADGDDDAMTPVELLVAALSSCVAFYAGRYLARHGLNRDGLQVTAEFAMATDHPARVSGVRLKIRVPDGIPPHREAGLLAMATHCTVHNTLRQAPDLAIELT